MQFNGPNKTKWKIKAVATKIQPDGSDKKEIRKRGYLENIIIALVKWNEKCTLLLLKCTLMVQMERNQEKVVVTKICFYGSTKTEWKIEVCDGRQGFCCQMIKMRSNNPMLTSKLNVLLNISDPCWWMFMRLL